MSSLFGVSFPFVPLRGGPERRPDRDRRLRLGPPDCPVREACPGGASQRSAGVLLSIGPDRGP